MTRMSATTHQPKMKKTQNECVNGDLYGLTSNPNCALIFFRAKKTSKAGKRNIIPIPA